MSRFITENFLPVRVHVRDDAAEFKKLGERYNAQWTPTILELDSTGTERHRVEGFLDADALLAQLTLGLGHMAFKTQRWTDAERWFESVAKDFPNTDAAAESVYWAGVSRYKNTNDNVALADTARRFREKYQDTTWAQKSSVWGEPARMSA